MIDDKCFTAEWLDSFKKVKEHQKIQTNILEKMIYALHLVENLKQNGLQFIFKGGTSLVLLLDEDNRFSIDVDIICNTNKQDLEKILNSIVEKSKFNSVLPDENRSYKKGIPKAHYSFQFDSVFDTKVPGKILLDILLTDPIYPEYVEKPIQTKWIEVNQAILVNLPSIDSITGDKLTAFAPNTIGIPYFKNDRRFAMEICKQLFDLSRLFDQITSIKVVADSFLSHAKQEIEFRESSNLNANKVLHDIIDTCVTITKRGKTKDDREIENFKLLQNGIKSFGSGYLMTGNFRIDEAIAASARTAHLAAKILVGDLGPIQPYKGQELDELTIEDPQWSFLNTLKRQPDKSIFYFWFNTVKLLK